MGKRYADMTQEEKKRHDGYVTKWREKNRERFLAERKKYAVSPARRAAQKAYDAARRSETQRKRAEWSAANNYEKGRPELEDFQGIVKGRTLRDLKA